MKSTRLALLTVVSLFAGCSRDVPELKEFPLVKERFGAGAFALVDRDAAGIYHDSSDFKVVSITAGMLSDDVERVTGRRPTVQTAASLEDIPARPSVIAGTVGKSVLVDALVRDGVLDVDALQGKWESYLIQTVRHPSTGKPLLVIAGSDRRGTAFGLTALEKAIGVSPWYWWADVVPPHRKSLYVQRGRFVQKEPSVQYRGIFINDERFGGWARWVEQTYDKETGKVGPKVYRQVFELLLRLGGNYLWPAMHPGTQAFNDDPENARLADDYAIVMGSSHCEQMLRNNEGEWKAVGTYGDFNYITNRKTMQDYWETRVRTNGKYENTYTLGLRGIHDYPMEGARTTEERVALMQQAIDDQRDMLRRNIDKPLEEIPQVLCTYEEVLDAYKNGLVVPDDVTLLWSDDKHGYTRNLCNPDEMERPGGAGIYYHLSYHGDPASWIWLSPLSPAFISTELTKAYTYGARKIWVFNVGDIKPAEKELTFAMELAWDIDRWTPEKACGFIPEWAARTFGKAYAREIADIMDGYYRLMASGKDSHVWFLEYPEEEIRERIDTWRKLADQALALEKRIPEDLQPAYFELVLYPVRGAQMINEYQLLARTSLALASAGDEKTALADAARAKEMYEALDAWTRQYNEDLLDGKWKEFFNWKPYHWFRSPVMDAPMATPEMLDEVAQCAAPRFLPVEAALSEVGATIDAEVACEMPLWIHALTPIRNFSKAPADNVFCRVESDSQSFEASATPINNIWHAPYVGPMWSQVGTVRLTEGENTLRIVELKPDARIDGLFIGFCPPFPNSPLARIPAAGFTRSSNPSENGRITTVSGLGFEDGVLVLPFDTPSYNSCA
ncbi:MAG: glycosyl hydrolase 115 family protein, partial [Bacteroidales bacterium]|nr:glycosyl hydrolase 115 family protein [Bacteroidales bacterium]